MSDSSILILRNFSIDHLKRPLEKAGEARGVAISVTLGGYDTISQDLLALPEQRDLVVCSLILETFAGGLWTPGWTFEHARSELTALYELLKQRSGARVVVNTFVPPTNPWLHGTTSSTLSGRTQAVRELNAWIRTFVRENDNVFALVDWEALASRLGTEASLDQRFGLMMKAPFKTPFLEAYAAEILRILQAARLRHKVIALDGDNTLWGGIVGELGPTGVSVDPFEYPGVAFSRLQYEVLQLREQGVLLVACSKNNEADFWEVLQKHPHCLLKKEHFTAARINWTDKAENLVSLAQELNLGIDSFVFLDDNPAECERVRQALPEVTVLQIPEHLHRLPGWLVGQGLFDRVSLSSEDLGRAAMYEIDQQRQSAQANFQSVEEFLHSLEIQADIHEMRPGEISRVAQLTQKTNQFNLTTKRYTEAEIAAEAPNRKIVTLSVKDRFGDLGLVGVAILEVGEAAVEVDTFLLSCRVIGRKLENALLATAVRLLPDHAPRRLAASFRPTAKNAQVAALWPQMGLKPTAEQDGKVAYEGGFDELACEVPSFIFLTANS